MKLFNKNSKKKKPLEKLQDKATLHWNRALYSLKHRQYNRAVLDLRHAIDGNADYQAKARKILGTLMSRHMYESVVTIGLAIEPFFDSDAWVYIQVADAYRMLRNKAKAQEMYQKALQLDPTSEHAYYGLAACPFRIPLKGDFLVEQTKEAQTHQHFKPYSYVLLFHEDLPVYDPLTVSSVKKKQYQKVLEQTKNFPKSWETHFDLAVLHDVCGEYEKAWKAYEKAKSLDPQNIKVRNNQAILQATHFKNSEEAYQTLTQALKEAPRNRYLVLNLAILSRRRKRSLMACRYYSYLGELLRHTKGSFDLDGLAHEAFQAYEEGNLTQARKLYEVLLTEEVSIESLLRLGSIAERLGNMDQASHYWKLTLKLDPQNFDAQNQLQKYAQHLEERAEALQEDQFLLSALDCLTQSIQIYPHRRAYEQLSKVYEQLDEPEKAAHALKQAKHFSKS